MSSLQSKDKPSPKRWVKPVFRFFLKLSVLVLFLFRYLLGGSKYGVLCFALLLYFGVKVFGFIEPFDVGELMAFLVSLDESTITQMSSMTLTVFGMLVAFDIGIRQQRHQTIEQRKLEFADELDAFFMEASLASTNVLIFCEAGEKVYEAICRKEEKEKLLYLYQNWLLTSQNLNSSQQVLKQKSINVSNFHSKYSLIIASTFSANKLLNGAINALQNIANKSWVQAPLAIDNEFDALRFINDFDYSGLLDYKVAYEQNFDAMNFTCGGLRGRLGSSTVEMNLAYLSSFLKAR